MYSGIKRVEEGGERVPQGMQGAVMSEVLVDQIKMSCLVKKLQCILYVTHINYFGG